MGAAPAVDRMTMDRANIFEAEFEYDGDDPAGYRSGVALVGKVSRDQLREHLRAAQIGTGIHYPAPVHLHPAYRGRVPVGPTGLRTTERVVGEILSLPIYPQLSDADIARVTAEIGRFFH